MHRIGLLNALTYSIMLWVPTPVPPLYLLFTRDSRSNHRLLYSKRRPYNMRIYPCSLLTIMSTHPRTVINAGTVQTEWSIFPYQKYWSRSLRNDSGPSEYPPPSTQLNLRSQTKSSKLVVTVWDELNTGVRSTMKLCLQVTLVITAIFTNMALVSGLSCDSNCAACWKVDDITGEDTKFTCNNGHCGSTCPPGYNGIHCARYERC